MKTVLAQIVGYTFLVLGIAGLILPFLQGFLFIGIGLAILAKSAPWAQRLVDRLRQRYPSLGRMLDKTDAKAEQWRLKVQGLFQRQS